ncbi:MAG: hypothetical protein ACRDQZ_14570, partial [Mycobacteriales bacterium]
WLYIAVAPSRSPKQVPPEAFADRALAVAREILPESFNPSWSDGDLARFTVSDPAPGKLFPNRHILNIYRAGLLDLQWGLNMVTDTDGDTLLSLSEIRSAIRKVHKVVQNEYFRTMWPTSPEAA